MIEVSLADPHHDGSELYVPEPPTDLGDETTVLLRVPRGSAADRVVLRYIRDGEPKAVEATVDRTTDADVWWRASFPVWSTTTPYRWLLSGGDYGYTWVTGAGLQEHDAPGCRRLPGFRSSERAGVASRLGRLPGVPRPVRVVRRGRGSARLGRSARVGLASGREGAHHPVEWFGGDLPGLEQRLDHIASLGANVVYLTPFFPARSTHRYDATTFDSVDPLLGGDAALTSLTRAAHDRGIRVLGDLTTNHVGSGHEWFVAAQEGREPERDFFYFDDSLPYGYECWASVPTLPKLDYRSRDLRERVYEGNSSVVRRWLEPPFALDGWRIDVAHLTARRHDVDVLVEVSQGIRATALSARPDAVVLAEHAHDARADLRAGGWHGTMNYAGFTRPVWSWLRADVLPPMPSREFVELPVGVPRLAGEHAVEGMRSFRAGVPWDSVLHSWVILDSHDSARFKTIAGSRERQLVGMGLQMTTPGVPMVFAGDEIGLEGDWGEDARRTIPWDRPETWDADVLGAYRRLISLRRSSPALARGGIRYAHVGSDAILYLRESKEERVLCLARRRAGEALRMPLQDVEGSGVEVLASEGQSEEARVEDGAIVFPGEGPSFQALRIE